MFPLGFLKEGIPVQVAGGAAQRSGAPPAPVSPSAHKELLQGVGFAFLTFKILYVWGGGGMPFFCGFFFSLSLLNTYTLASNTESVTRRSPHRASSPLLFLRLRAAGQGRWGPADPNFRGQEEKSWASAQGPGRVGSLCGGPRAAERRDCSSTKRPRAISSPVTCCQFSEQWPQAGPGS